MQAELLLPRLRAMLPPLRGGLEDLLLPLYQGIVLMILRVAAEKLCVTPIRRVLKARPNSAAKSTEERAMEVVENAFLVLFIAPLSVWGWWVMLRHNGPCTPTTPQGCLVGWPKHPVSIEFRWWWLSVGGLYCGEMIGTLLGGLGFKLSVEMFIHHVITIVLMLFAYYGGLHRYGQMATTVLDTSNTFLHAAKAVHALGLPQLKTLEDVMFQVFGATFFVVRVLMPPFCMIVPGLIYGRVLPTATYCITNALMMAIYGLQLMWFKKIVNIAMGNAKTPPASTPTTPKGGSPTP